MTESRASTPSEPPMQQGGGVRARVFLSAAQQLLFLRGTPALMYHKVAAPPPKTSDPFLYVTPERLDQHLRLLLQAGFSPARFEDGLKGQDNRERRFVVTFDDGCRNALENGLPVLARHGVRAIQFIVAGALGGINRWDLAAGDVSVPLMDVREIREWLAAGQEIGSHSLTHPNLKGMTPAETRAEVADSRKRLEDLFGVPVRHFSYPFGCHNPLVEQVVAEAGYESACGVEFGVNNHATPRFNLRRVIPLSRMEWVRKACHRLIRIARRRRSVDNQNGKL